MEGISKQAIEVMIEAGKDLKRIRDRSDDLTSRGLAERAIKNIQFFIEEVERAYKAIQDVIHLMDETIKSVGISPLSACSHTNFCPLCGKNWVDISSGQSICEECQNKK